MKLISVKGINNEWIPTVKLSDEKGKYTGDPKMIELAKRISSDKEINRVHTFICIKNYKNS